MAAHSQTVRPMTEKQLLEIKLEESKDFAEWLSIAHDLTHVIDATKQLYNLLEKDGNDSTIIRSLWSSALITYIRCFTSGVRKSKLSANIFSHLEGDPIGTHQYYKDTRDRHIAHSVNIFEEIKIGIVPSDTFPERPAYIGLGHLYAYRLTDAKEGVWQLGKLASIALIYTREKIEKEKEKVRRKFDELSKKELVKLKPIRIQPKGGGSAAKMKRS